ncbi:hypothetical protein KP509_39G057800 [Ceratopteris richardii]|nr:hypothetical protein KP509_39G057800 [Ceratopteris richardii]
MTDPSELLESLKAAAVDYEDIDVIKLWERYLSLKKDFLQVEAENLFVESCLTSETEPISDSETEMRALERQFSDLVSMTTRESEEIKSLIGVFTEEMENFPKLMDTVLDHFAECDKKVHLDSSWYRECMDESTHCVGSDVEQKALELSILTGSLQNEILELEIQTSKDEEYYKHIRNLNEVHNKYELLGKILSFFSEWTIAECEHDMVTLVFKNPSLRHKKGTENSSTMKNKRVPGNKHVKPSKEVVYKLHVKFDPKTLAVESAQLEPRSEASVEDILKEMVMRRMMHSLEVSGEPHNDMEYLLRKAGQRITSLRKSAA